MEHQKCYKKPNKRSFTFSIFSRKTIKKEKEHVRNHHKNTSKRGKSDFVLNTAREQ
jgi:hypothetical protein